MRMVRFFTASLLAGALGFPPCPSPAADAKPVLVFAAKATAGIAEEMGKAFSESSGVPVRVSSGGTPDLARRIFEGEPADIFIAAGFSNLARLQLAGLVDEQTTYLWIRSRLVVIAPSQAAGALTSSQEIADPRVRRLALADPDRVPLGMYSRQSLTHYRLWDALRQRIVPLTDSQSVLTSVESGAADLGIVYASDARTSSRVKIVLELPEESHKPIQFFVSLVAHTGASPAARSFLGFLKSEAVRQRLIQAGFFPAFP
ncbi:MAG: molybdate ABC transporter substrate-binding protein [Acidobacteria bacterium]|nr:molybdate ABC transporter substrate-binding protein [Acidobacteriota bacterium]